MKDSRMMALDAVGEQDIDKRIADVTAQLKDVCVQQDEQIISKAPRGKFSKPALSRLADTLNKVFNVLGIDKVIVAPSASASIFDPELTSAILMIAAAISDAIKEEVLDSELEINTDAIVTDDDIRAAIAKISTAISNKGFKRWLTSEGPRKEPKEEMPEENEVEEKEPDEQDIMALFAARA